MTRWGHTVERHDLWLRLLDLLDELRGIVDEWVAHDPDLKELHDGLDAATEPNQMHVLQDPDVDGSESTTEDDVPW